MKKSIFALLSFFICSCAQAAINLTVKDVDQPINASVGQEYLITLPANATTGYSWQFSSDNGDKFDILQNNYVVEARPNGMVGVGGQAIYRIRITEPGTFSLQAKYFRPWEEFVPERDKLLQWNFEVK